MLKKILKSCLAIGITIGITAPTMAVDLGFHGFGALYWGPVNRGGDWSSYNETSGGMLVHLKAKGEKISTGVQVKYVLPGSEVVEMKRLYVDYKAMDAMTLKIGMAAPKTSETFAKGAGLVRGGESHYNLEYTFAEAYGLHADYKMSDTLQATFGVLSQDPYGQAYNTGVNGSGSHASIGANLGSIGIRAAYMSGTSDVAATPMDDPVSSSGTMVSAKYSMGKSMSIALDYQSRKLGEGLTNADGDVITADTTNAVTALQVRGNKIGPGDIIVTVANDTETVGDADGVTTAYSDLCYSIGVGRGELLQIVYLSKKVGEADAMTWMQLGLIKFF